MCCSISSLQNDENQNEIVTTMLEDIVMEVILSNQKKPSIPGIILETIIDIVNGVIDLEEPVSSEQSLAVSSEVLSSVASSIVADIIDEVIQSNNRQPSIPGVVLQLITEMITNSDSNNNNNNSQMSQSREATATSATTTQDGVNKQLKQTSESHRHAELMPKVCYCHL